MHFFLKRCNRWYQWLWGLFYSLWRCTKYQP